MVSPCGALESVVESVMSLIGSWLDLYYLSVGRKRLACLTILLQSSKVVLPERTLILSQLKQIVPAVNAAVVTVIKVDFNGVVADRLNVLNRDVSFAGLKHFLAPAVTAHFSRGGIHAQKFGAENDRLPSGIGQLQGG